MVELWEGDGDLDYSCLVFAWDSLKFAGGKIKIFDFGL